jgi:hypothetical protein
MEMKKKINVLALSLLMVLTLAGAIFVPVVSAEEIAQIPQLQYNTDQKAVMVGNDLSPDESIHSEQINQMTETTENPTISKIPYGSIIQHSNNGITTVFDSTGKQLFMTNDADAKEIATPEGYLAASKIHQVPNGSIIKTNDEITTVYSEGKCILTVLNPDNLIVLPGYEGWIESARDLSVSELGQFIAYWTVPSDPPDPQTDTIDFLFNAIQPSSSAGIVQPVLEWNQAGSGRWTGSAWYVDQYGVGYPSDPINVDEGDSIKGTLGWDPGLQQWNIIFADQTTGELKSIFSENAANIGSTNLQIYVALEGYGVVDDSDVPGDTIFRNMRIRDLSLATVDIDWVKRIENDPLNALTGLDVTWTSDTQVTLHTAN